MFESLVQGYALNTAPSTVIPVGVSIEEAKKTYHLEHVDKLASNENPFGVSPKAQAAMTEALQSAHLYPDSTRDTLLKQMLSEKHGLRPDQIMLKSFSAPVQSVSSPLPPTRPTTTSLSRAARRLWTSPAGRIQWSWTARQSLPPSRKRRG